MSETLLILINVVIVAALFSVVAIVAPRNQWGRFTVAAIALTLICLAGWFGIEYARLPDTKELLRANPEQSSLMRIRSRGTLETGRRLQLRQRFIPLQDVSQPLQRAVVLSEDARFWVHNGVDWIEMRAAISDAWKIGEPGRGASTITQQLAKNLYLSEDRSVLRKLKELIIAHRLENNLSKRRILELYMNYAEWGEGVFGVEAATQAYFDQQPSDIDAGEAAILAAILPAPRHWSPANPTPRFIERTWHIADLLAADNVASPPDIYKRVEKSLGLRPSEKAAPSN